MFYLLNCLFYNLHTNLHYYDLIYFLFFTDYKDGFGGQFGVQADRVDKSALGWEHHEKLNKHESQKDYAKGKEY